MQKVKIASGSLLYIMVPSPNWTAIGSVLDRIIQQKKLFINDGDEWKLSVISKNRHNIVNQRAL